MSVGSGLGTGTGADAGVIRVIFFYSRKNKTSMNIKDQLENLGVDVDIETISVDNSTTRDLLLSDTKYMIDVVPSLLVLYSGGTHRVYKGDKLNNWVKELIENVELELQQQQLQQQQYVELQPEPEEYPISKPLLGKNRNDIRSNLSYPGIKRDAGLTMDQERIVSGAIIQNTKDPSPTGVKKEGMSAAELAKLQLEERERWQEEIDSNRPVF